MSSRHCPQRRQKKSSVHASYIRGGQCFENEERHHVFKALSNTEAEDILCVQRNQCQLLSRHLDGRFSHPNACKELALLQLMDATNIQPCTAGTPKKKGACRRLAWLQRQTGFWTQQKDASTNHKQLTSKLLSCELLIVCTCKLLLQSSKIFRRTWTLHLCPVGATADCESVHRSCPRCGSKIHSQQVSVLGHQSAVV